MELTFYHNYIENTTACGTVLTEHLLNAGRRPQTSERSRDLHVTVYDKRRKIKERERNLDGTWSQGRSCGRGNFSLD